MGASYDGHFINDFASDSFFGGNGNDTLDGRDASSDFLRAEAGDDWLYVNNDDAAGGPGNDRLEVDAAGRLTDGTGSDYFYVHATQGEVNNTVITDFSSQDTEVATIAKRDFMPGSNVVSDGLSCWLAVEQAGCTHFPMRTGSGRQAARWSPFAWVNTMLGNIKTALVGTYHHVSAKHAASYLASFAYRFNRRYQLDSIVERLAWAALRTAPQPYRIISADA